jgi:acetyl esterase/lipase
MKQFYFIIIGIIIFTKTAISQNYTIPLWEGEIPNLKVTAEKEKSFYDQEIFFIKNIQKPNITVYLPSKKNATGEAVIICPGGGYWNLAYYWEGRDIARAFNARGIAAIVLKYRLPTSDNYIIRDKSPLLDAQRAMRLVRYHAPEWNIKPDKIGIMGFSAGGHLASTLSTHYDSGNSQSEDPVDRLSCRPDFSILIYPVISFIKPYSHKGSAEALLGKNASQDLLKFYSNELQVTKDTPPAFLVHSMDDGAVPVENSIAYYQALKEHAVSAEMHLYPYGGHGYSLAIGKGHLSGWMNLCIEWTKYITKDQT